MSEILDQILARCMERMEVGASLEACLSDYPNEAAELEPLLRMTQQIKGLSNIGPRPAFARTARAQLESQLAPRGNAAPSKRSFQFIRQTPQILLQRAYGMGVLQIALAVMLALIATTGGVAYAANASNPGDVLHRLDLAMENAQLNLTSNVADKVQLRLKFAGERLAEARVMLWENDVAHSQEAINEYEAEIFAAAQLVGETDGMKQDALRVMFETAQGVHRETLAKLLDTAPAQARDAIQNALNDSGGHGKPENVGGPGNGNGAGNNQNHVGAPTKKPSNSSDKP